MDADHLDEAERALERGSPADAIRELRGAGGGGGLVARGRLLLARALVAQNRDEDAGPIVGELLGDASLEPDERALALALAGHVHAVVDAPSRGRELARESLAIPQASGAARTLAHLTISRSLLFEGDLDAAILEAKVASDAAAGAPFVTQAGAWLHEAYVAFQVDDFAGAEASIARVQSALVAGPLDETPRARLVARARHALGALRFHRGDWAGLSELLDPRPDVVAGLETSDDEWAVMAGLLIVVHVHSDRLREAAALVAESASVLTSGSRPILVWGCLLLAEARDDQAAAHALAERLISTLDRLGSPVGFRTTGPDLVRILLAAGQREAAWGLAHRLEALAEGTAVRSVHAAASLARGLVTGDPVAFETAARGFLDTDRRLEAATALEELARVSPRKQAARPGREASRIYAAIGARRDERRLASALRARGIATTRRGRPRGPGTGWAGLSTTEADVAGLVAEGLTNAEIGARLAISPRTVETHVTHVLNKLSVSGRASIAAIAARERD